MTAIKQIEEALAAGPTETRRWELWTSNSWRRIQGVIEPTIQLHDNHPDLHATTATLEYVVAAQPANMRKVLAHIAAQDAEIARLREALDSVFRYGLDTLSGRTDGPDDRHWQRQGVNEMTKRAQVALATTTPKG